MLRETADVAAKLAQVFWDGTCMPVIVGVVAAGAGLIARRHESNMPRRTKLLVSAMFGLVLLGSGLLGHEVVLSTQAHHAAETSYHAVLALTLFVQFVLSSILVTCEKESRGTSAATATGFLMTQYGIYLTFELTFNGVA